MALMMAVHPFGGLVGGYDADVVEAGVLEIGSVLAVGEGTGDASDPRSSLGAFFYDVDGNQHLRPVRRRGINRRLNKRDGGYRMSAEYDLVVDGATGATDGYVRIRLDQTADDRISDYNRPEHFRAFPEDDPVFAAIQRPLRSSAESANRTIDDHLPRERLHHFGFDKNQLSMLAWQSYRNAQAEAIFALSRVDDADTGPPLQETG